jgi:hypothetical protein
MISPYGITIWLVLILHEYYDGYLYGINILIGPYMEWRRWLICIWNGEDVWSLNGMK